MRKYPLADYELNEIVERFLFDLKKDEIDYSALSYSFLAGVNIREVQTEMIYNLLGIKTTQIDPFEVVKASTGFSSGVNLKEIPSRFSPAAGIALRLF
jgi:Tfp pilus assembly PilM family ATPase